MSRRVVGNAASVMMVQAGSYVLPLINIPYLLRVIGPEHYGLIAFSQAVMMYFVTLSDYGFDLSATRELAVHRDDAKLRSELYCAVMTIKCGLCLLSLLILCLLAHFVSRFHSDAPVFFASFGIVIGTVLFPQWFFLGVEKMYWLSVDNLAANAIFTAGIFLFVRRPSDFLIAAILQAGGKLVSGILGLIILFSTEHVKLTAPTFSRLRHQVVDGWHVFLSYAASTFYTSSNAVALGLVCGMTQVGYFSAAYKIFTAFQLLTVPMGQALYPHVCSLAHRSQQLAVEYLRRAMIVIGGLTFMAGLLVILLARVIVHVAMGPKYMASVRILELLAMAPFAFAINNIFGTQGMLNFGMKEQFSRTIIISALFNTLILVPLCYWFKAPGAAVSGLITQTAMAIMRAMALRGRGIDLLPRLSDLRAQVSAMSVFSLRRAWAAEK